MALLLFLFIGLAVVLRRRRAIQQQVAEAGIIQEDAGDMDPVGGWVEDPAADRAERERREWAETVRLRQQAHHIQQQHHHHPDVPADEAEDRERHRAAAEPEPMHFPG